MAYSGLQKATLAAHPACTASFLPAAPEHTNQAQRLPQTPARGASSFFRLCAVLLPQIGGRKMGRPGTHLGEFLHFSFQEAAPFPLLFQGFFQLGFFQGSPPHQDLGRKGTLSCACASKEGWRLAEAPPLPQATSVPARNWALKGSPPSAASLPPGSPSLWPGTLPPAAPSAPSASPAGWSAGTPLPSAADSAGGKLHPQRG